MSSSSSQSHSRTWTTRALLRWTADHFHQHAVQSPRLAAEMLLAHVLGVKRLELYMQPDRPASALERTTFRELVQRAAKHEPVEYLTGHAPFFSLMLEVTPDVLIPRPSTEALVEHVIQHVRGTPGFARPTIADVGTGSGAIAIALAKHLEGARVIATDLSEAALAIASKNARSHGVAECIDFRHGDLLEPLGSERVQFLLSNPPYISDEEWAQVASNVRDYEPTSALRGGTDGLRYLRPLIAHAREHLHSPGQLVLEIAASQKQAVLGLANERGNLTHAHVLADHERLPRVLVADAM